MVSPSDDARTVGPLRLPSVADASGRTFDDAEIAAVTRVLRSGMLSSVWGTETRALERDTARLFGTAHGVAGSSGTAAIHLAVAAAGLSPGDEVITTPISDFGSVAPILAQNAVPVFVDVEARTGNLDPAAVEAAIGPRTRAILAVHLFGAPADVVRLRRIADAHGLLLIEDCAQAWLTTVDDHGTLAGTVGHIGCFSLQQWKHISCGDGGLTVTADEHLATGMRLFADKGWPREGGGRTHVSFGLNYRMTELQAAVARVQLRKLPGVVARRRTQAERLLAGVGRLPGIGWPDPRGHSWWMFPMLVADELGGAHHAADVLAGQGLTAIPGYLDRPLYANPALASAPIYGHTRYPLAGVPGRDDVGYHPGLCPVAERLIDRSLLVLPWNEQYSDRDVDDIAGAIRAAHRILAG